VAAATLMQIVWPDHTTLHQLPAYIPAQVTWNVERPETPHNELPGPVEPWLSARIQAAGTAVMPNIGPLPSGGVNPWPGTW
jgi:hypothetical protein